MHDLLSSTFGILLLGDSSPSFFLFWPCCVCFSFRFLYVFTACVTGDISEKLCSSRLPNLRSIRVPQSQSMRALYGQSCVGAGVFKGLSLKSPIVRLNSASSVNGTRWRAEPTPAHGLVSMSPRMLCKRSALSVKGVGFEGPIRKVS